MPSKGGVALVAVIALLLSTSSQASCEAGHLPLDLEGDVFGGGCPMQGPAVGDLMYKFLNRTGPEEAVIEQVARAYPVADEFGGIKSLNYFPTNNATLNGDPTTVMVALHVLRISEINQKSQTFKMNYMIKTRWRDCRLLMNCTSILVSDKSDTFGLFWRPRLKIAEREADDHDMLVERHLIFGHGWDYFAEEHVSRFRCAFDFTELPFDIQNCKLTFLLPDVPSSTITLRWDDLGGEELSSAEWKITQPQDWSKEAQEKEVALTSRPSTISYGTSELVAKFSLERRPHFLVNNYIELAWMFYFMSWIGMWIDINAVPARAAVAVIPVLVTSNKMSTLAMNIPPICYPTRLGSFMRLTMAMLVLHVLEFGVVHYAGRRCKLLAQEFKQLEEVVQDYTTAGKTAPAPSRATRIEFRIVKYISLYFEVASRALSPLVYAIAAGIVMHA